MWGLLEAQGSSALLEGVLPGTIIPAGPGGLGIVDDCAQAQHLPADGAGLQIKATHALGPDRKGFNPDVLPQGLTVEEVIEGACGCEDVVEAGGGHRTCGVAERQPGGATLFHVITSANDASGPLLALWLLAPSPIDPS